MIWLRVPFRYWPLRWHVGLALLLVATTAAACWGVLQHSAMQMAVAQQELENARKDAEDRRRRAPTSTADDWTRRLPPSQHLDEVIRQVGAGAETHKVQITSLAVQRQAATATELGQSRLVLAATAGYPGFKAWLGEMLDRNETLGVQALIFRRTADPHAQDVQLTLVLFTKD